jgi:hypothetical protein
MPAGRQTVGGHRSVHGLDAILANGWAAPDDFIPAEFAEDEAFWTARRACVSRVEDHSGERAVVASMRGSGSAGVAGAVHGGMLGF